MVLTNTDDTIHRNPQARIERLGVAGRRVLARNLTPRFPSKPYIPHVPHPPQQAFLLLNGFPEVFYGGAAGGGKSDAGLMAVLQYCDVPGYSALVLRRTFADLALPGAIMNRAISWLSNTDAKMRDGGKLWEFPTEGDPATLQFGYAQTHADVYRYQGAEFQTIFMDELTHFEGRTYQYLFSRLRGPALPCINCSHGTSQPAGELRSHDEDHDWCECGHEHIPALPCSLNPEMARICDCDVYRPIGCECLDPTPDRRTLKAAADGLTLADVPLRMRSGSNPGGVGHEWVRARFIDPATRLKTAVFVPAKLQDNPSLDRKAYRQGLSHLTATEQARLESGNWDVQDDGDVFERAWFRIVDEAPKDCRLLRFWDFAATAVKPTKSGAKDPDWTVGALVGLTPQGQFYVIDVRRFRKSPFDTEAEVRQVAALDGRRVAVRIEQEPGSSGVTVVDHWPHDDQVDAVSGAVDGLVGARRARIIA
jgi:hypothetical protein